ncbi:unknown [Acanthamoeba polyphaga mimivirus]|uniref:Uncharacterized protein R744 n=1 Tax=Acanthamoeba polyphaga mimivirus TaxID=212035 RepID=YR744_MIMIV|nr:RecName: Full=Uncharacterized protein R744 [Acanthamoeba polyphaga mimivirus]AAV51004.1 unknown [Acanthamoeba polyphaga mimivirus]
MFYKIYYIYPNKQLESVEDYEYVDIQSATNCMFDYIWRHKKPKPTQKITDFINMDCTYSIGIFSINVYNKYNKLICITNTNELKFSGKRIEIISRIKKIPITDNYPEHIFYVYDNLPDNTNVAVLCKICLVKICVNMKQMILQKKYPLKYSKNICAIKYMIQIIQINQQINFFVIYIFSTK